MTGAPAATPPEVRPAVSAGVPRAVVVLAVTGTFVIAFLAFWLSFTALRDLAALAGVPAELAWIWPLIVDGVILEATISVVALRDAPIAARRYAWVLLIGGAGVSVAANITHAVVVADARVPATIAALVASVPPLVLLAMTHLSVVLARHRTPTTAPEAGRPRLALATANESRPRRPAASKAPASRESARQEALGLAGGGMPPAAIARRLGVHRTTVARWLDAPDDDGRSTP